MYQPVKPKLPFAITSKGPATSKNGPTWSVLPKQRRAVLHAVSPNTVSPTSAAIILDGILPPRPGYSLPLNFGPVYQAGSHPTGPYFNDPTTLEGGSYILVDTESMSVLQLEQGVSTNTPTSVAAYMASLHKHTGGVDVNGNPLSGSTLDTAAEVTNYLNNAHLSGNPDPSLAPILVPGSLSAITYPSIESSSFDAEIANFQFQQPPGCNAWLIEIRLYAIPTNGHVWDKNRSINKGDIAANVTGTYAGIWGGCISGQAYDLWAAYVDVRGIPSLPVYLATTSTSPTVFGAPALSPTTAPHISNIGQSVAIGEGNGTFDYSVPFTLDVNSTTTNATVTEIELLAITATTDGSTGPGNAAVVNYLVPNASGNYVGVWPTLGANNSYDLYLRNRGEKGDVSAITFVQTTIAPQISNGALAPNPDTLITPTIVSGSKSALTYPLILSGSYDAEMSWSLTYPSGYQTWLREIRLYAVPSNGAQPFPVSRAISYDIEVVPNGQYTAIWFSLVAGQAYDLWVTYIDTQANTSQPAFLATTAAHPALTGGAVALTPTTAPVVTGVVNGTPIGEGNGTFDFPVEFTLDANSTNQNHTLTEIELMAVVSGSGFGNLAVVSKMVPNASGTYYQVWPTLGAGNDYELYVRNMGQLGDVSAYGYVTKTGLVPLSVGTAQSAQMPQALYNSGPTISLSQFLNQVIDGSAGYDQNYEFALGDFPANNQPNWFSGIGVAVRSHGTTADSVYTVIAPNPSSVAFQDTINGIAAGKSIDIGFAYLDMSGQSSNITWPAGLNGSQTVQAQGPVVVAGISNVNFVSDSNMDFTGTNGASAYWTYAGFDPNRFKVNRPGSNSPAGLGTSTTNYLSCNANGGAAVGAVCAYSIPIVMQAGLKYTFTCVGNLNEAHSGTAYIGLVDQNDKAANRPTPLTIYASAPIPHGGNPPVQVTPVTLNCTISGSYILALWANGVTGSVAWMQPQVEFGSVFSGYKAGAAVNVENTVDHSAQSLQVQNTVKSTIGGGIDFAQATHSNKDLNNIADTSTYAKTSQAPSIGPNLIDNYRFDVLANTTASPSDYYFHSWNNFGTTGGITIIQEAIASGGNNGNYDLLIRSNPNSIIGPNSTNYAALGSAIIPCIAGEIIVGFAIGNVQFSQGLPNGISRDNYVAFRFFDNTKTSLGDQTGTSMVSNGAQTTVQLAQTTVPNGAAFVSIYCFAGLANGTGNSITLANALLNDVRFNSVGIERVTPANTNLTGQIPHGVNSSTVLSVINSSGQYSPSQAISGDHLPFVNLTGDVTNVIQVGGTYNPATAWQVQGANLPNQNGTTNDLAAVGNYGGLISINVGNGTTPAENDDPNRNVINVQGTALPALGTWKVVCNWFVYGTNYSTSIDNVGGGSAFFTSTGNTTNGQQGFLGCQAIANYPGSSTPIFGLARLWDRSTGLFAAGTWHILAYRINS